MAGNQLKNIDTLRDIGKYRKCLIIGGGLSVRDFDFTRLQDLYIISTNNHCYNIADMIVYYDKEIRDYYINHSVKPTQLLAGFKHSNQLDWTFDKCTHYYNYSNMVFGDTGFHCLQFADQIFNFQEIYLLGYDYYTSDISYHFEENQSDSNKMKSFIKMTNNVLPRYNTIKWRNSIYNCNNKSKLELFNFKLPY